MKKLTVYTTNIAKQMVFPCLSLVGSSHEPEHPAQHRLVLLFLGHLALFRRPEKERENLMKLIRQHTDDTEVDNIMKSAAETLIEQGIAKGKAEAARLIEQGKAEGIEQGKDEVYRAWYADWERRRQAAAEKGIPFDDPPPLNPNHHINQE